MNCDVVFVAMENWDEVWRRNQPVAAGFAQRSPGNKILFIGLSIDASYLIRKRRFGALWKELTRGALRNPEGFSNIYLLNSLKLLPNTLAIGRMINRWHERRQIRGAMRKLQITNPLLWINPYYAVHMLGKLGERAVIYDVGDDWTSFPQPSEWLRKLVVAEDVELTERADATIVVSERLGEMKRTQARVLKHIPNGAYLDRYIDVCHHTIERHPITASWRGKVFGYTGSIHQDRVNIEMIVALANAFPDATIALVGPNMLNAEASAKLAACPNIVLSGSVEFADVPKVMTAIDVCIVPHLVNDFTESLSPLKLYEYLASGLPIVSTSVSGFRDYAEVVRLADDNDSFIRACGEALMEPASASGRRQEIARQHSWDARLDDIEAVIASTLKREPKQSTGPMQAAHAF